MTGRAAKGPPVREPIRYPIPPRGNRSIPVGKRSGSGSQNVIKKDAKIIKIQAPRRAARRVPMRALDRDLDRDLGRGLAKNPSRIRGGSYFM